LRWFFNSLLGCRSQKMVLGASLAEFNPQKIPLFAAQLPCGAMIAQNSLKKHGGPVNRCRRGGGITHQKSKSTAPSSLPGAGPAARHRLEKYVRSMILILW